MKLSFKNRIRYKGDHKFMKRLGFETNRDLFQDSFFPEFCVQIMDQLF